MPAAASPVYSGNPMARGLSRRRLLALLAFLAIVLVPALAFAGGDGDFKEYESRGWGWMYLASFGFGFLTSLTPCVYPMIPITLAIFGARGKDVSKKRAILLATAYILGMGATYSSLGVTFALLGGGAGFGSQLASPYVVIPLVLLFLALAASMFGAFELNLPAGIQALQPERRMGIPQFRRQLVSKDHRPRFVRCHIHQGGPALPVGGDQPVQVPEPDQVMDMRVGLNRRLHEPDILLRHTVKLHIKTQLASHGHIQLKL